MAAWLFPVCAKIKNISKGDLMSGVEIAGAPTTMEFLSTGGIVLA